MKSRSLSVDSVDTVILPIGLVEERKESDEVVRLDFSNDRKLNVGECSSYGGYLDVCRRCKHNLLYNNQECECCSSVLNSPTNTAESHSEPEAVENVYDDCFDMDSASCSGSGQVMPGESSVGPEGCYEMDNVSCSGFTLVMPKDSGVVTELVEGTYDGCYETDNMSCAEADCRGLEADQICSEADPNHSEADPSCDHISTEHEHQSSEVHEAQQVSDIDTNTWDIDKLNRILHGSFMKEEDCDTAAGQDSGFFCSYGFS